MKKLLVLVLSLTFAGMAFAQSTYKDAKFTINFPGRPVEKEQDVETAVGLVTMYSLMYEGYNAAYMLAYIDYPARLVKDTAAKTEHLNNAKGGFINNFGAKITFERKISIQGHPGIYYKAQGNGTYIVMKSYLVVNRLYQIGIMRQDRFATPKEVNDFIGTFTLK